jgi:hypothetical protein
MSSEESADDIERQSNNSTSKSSRPPRWTIIHGFYATMGGFAFDTQELPAEEKFLPASLDRVTLDSDALYALAIATPELLPRLRTEEIQDKSKANNFAKTITCLQAAWFMAQCIYRLALGYSISTLQLNTLAHVIFTLIAYWLWWSKPVDINEPTIIRGDHAYGFCALLCMFSGKDWDGEMQVLEFQPEAVDEDMTDETG